MHQIRKFSDFPQTFIRYCLHKLLGCNRGRTPARTAWKHLQHAAWQLNSEIFL